MASAIYGSIVYKDKTYPFFLDGRRVIIVGRAWEYYEDFQDADEEESISGVTADNYQILFLRCRFGRSSLQQKVWFFPIGYILSSGNTGNQYDFTFEKISFYSDALNAFYPPQKAMTINLKQRCWDGSITINMKPFEQTAISFEYKGIMCRLNITRHVITRDGKSDIGNINSAFSFEFNTAQPCKELPQYWLALFDFLSFINYGTDIKFDKIILYNRNENRFFSHCADAYIFSDKEEYQQRPRQNTITVNDIPLDRLGAMFSKIASLRGSDKRLGYYFPESYKDGFRIDPNRWLIKAMSFEGLFKNCYPKFKQNEKEQFRIAKLAALAALNTVNQSQMSKSEREYFEDCQKQIERYEGRLEEMLNFIIKSFKDAFADILIYNRQAYGMNPEEYGKIYSNYRNRIAHGDIEPIGKKEEAVYIVLQAAIYFLLLDGAGLDSNTLRIVSKKLFCPI